MKQQLVVGFLFSIDHKRLVVIHKNRPEFLAGKVLPPGGKVETGETPKDAISREFKEETGVTIRGWKQFAVHETPEVEIFCFMYFSDARIKKVRTVTDETVEIVEVHKLPTNTIPNARWMITMALSFHAGEHASSFNIQEVHAA